MTAPALQPTIKQASENNRVHPADTPQQAAKNKELLTIGAMAKINNLSQQTLRLYDKMGLLCPSIRHPQTGYRYYDIRQSAVIDMIQYLKALGISLKEIKEYLTKKDIPKISAALAIEEQQLAEEMKQLVFKKRALGRTIKSLEDYTNAPADGTLQVEYMEQRQIYCVDPQINIYDYQLDVYEKILRVLKQSLALNHLPQIYFCNAGSLLRKERLLKKEFFSTEVFVFVDREFIEDSHVIIIPAHNYLCIYCNSFQKEQAYAQRMLTLIEEENYTVCGDYLCEVITELPLMETEERGMFLRLQIPIEIPPK